VRPAKTTSSQPVDRYGWPFCETDSFDHHPTQMIMAQLIPHSPTTSNILIPIHRMFIQNKSAKQFIADIVETQKQVKEILHKHHLHPVERLQWMKHEHTIGFQCTREQFVHRLQGANKRQRRKHAYKDGNIQHTIQLLTRLLI
jgi:hypothetical protein